MKPYMDAVCCFIPTPSALVPNLKVKSKKITKKILSYRPSFRKITARKKRSCFCGVRNFLLYVRNFNNLTKYYYTMFMNF